MPLEFFSSNTCAWPVGIVRVDEVVGGGAVDRRLDFDAVGIPDKKKYINPLIIINYGSMSGIMHTRVDMCRARLARLDS